MRHSISGIGTYSFDISDGRIRLAGETRLPIADARQAHERLAGGENVGKIILTF